MPHSLSLCDLPSQVGCELAIEENNAKGGMLGRKVERVSIRPRPRLLHCPGHGLGHLVLGGSLKSSGGGGSICGSSMLMSPGFTVEAAPL